MTKENHILVGNSFPLSLIRSRVVIEPRPTSELKALALKRGLKSFWGHENTLDLASKMIGVDLKPFPERPVLILSQNKLPTLGGIEFSECWILSPDYEPGYRPLIGEEVSANKIIGWQVLRMEWTS